MDRYGREVPPKTANSYRTIPVPAELVRVLERSQAERVLAGYNCGPRSFVFSSKTGRCLDQRNVTRALRRTQVRATTPDGRPTFPALHEGRKVEQGEVPDWHSCRPPGRVEVHRRGHGRVEIADLLGDTVQTVMNTYRQQLKDAKRAAIRTEKMAASSRACSPRRQSRRPVLIEGPAPAGSSRFDSLPG